MPREQVSPIERERMNKFCMEAKAREQNLGNNRM